MALKDQEKTSFIFPEGNYHYTVMPFSLKNAEATYQRMVTRMFRLQIGKIMEVYIDKMVVKSKKFEEHVLNLSEVFEILWHHRLCLNTAKCVFDVGFGKFLGYKITC